MAIAKKMICGLALGASLLLAQAPVTLVHLDVAAVDSSGRARHGSEDGGFSDHGPGQNGACAVLPQEWSRAACSRAARPARSFEPPSRRRAALDSDPFRSAEPKPDRPAGYLAQTRPRIAAARIRRFAIFLSAQSRRRAHAHPPDRRQGLGRSQLDANRGEDSRQSDESRQSCASGGNERHGTGGQENVCRARNAWQRARYAARPQRHRLDHHRNAERVESEDALQWRLGGLRAVRAAPECESRSRYRGGGPGFVHQQSQVRT